MTRPLYLPELESWTRGGGSESRGEAKTGDRALVLFETLDLEAAGLDALIGKVVEALEGDVVAETERGLLARFKDPLKAATAALNLKKAARLLNLKTRAGITWGPVPAVKGKAARQLRNETARRCLGIFSVALPHQILIDDDFKQVLQGKTEGYPDMMISEPTRVELAGVGRESLMELSTVDAGYAGPTEQHVPVLGDVEVSPIQVPNFPEDTDPSQYLVCDTCGKALKEDGTDGILVIEREEDVIKRFHLFHKGNCDTVKTHAYRELSEFANPECYLQFLIALFNNWAIKGLKIESADGLVRLVLGMYRRVFRPTTGREHLNFIGIMRLIHLMGE